MKCFSSEHAKKKKKKKNYSTIDELKIPNFRPFFSLNLYVFWVLQGGSPLIYQENFAFGDLKMLFEITKCKMQNAKCKCKMQNAKAIQVLFQTKKKNKYDFVVCMPPCLRKFYI